MLHLAVAFAERRFTFRERLACARVLERDPRQMGGILRGIHVRFVRRARLSSEERHRSKDIVGTAKDWNRRTRPQPEFRGGRVQTRPRWVARDVRGYDGPSRSRSVATRAPVRTDGKDGERDVMLASSDAGGAAFAEWKRWPNLAAVRFGNQYLMPADEIVRATPRLLSAGEAVCTALQTARDKRNGR